MQQSFRQLLTLSSIFIALPKIAAADTVTVDATIPEAAGVSYQKLSSAVTWANTAPNGPHTINVITNHTDNAPVLINAAMTINGKLNNVVGQKADILVDVAPGGSAAVAANRLSNVGITQLIVATVTINEPRCYIEIQTNGNVTISDLVIHPNEDLASLGTADGNAANRNIRTAETVDAIRMYEPVSGTGTYTLNRVWVTGSDASDMAIDIATGAALNQSIASIDAADQTIKRWSYMSSTSDRCAVIQTVDNSASSAPAASGIINLTMNNCMAGMGKSDALNLNAIGGTATIVGGLYGHCNRDGIRIPGDGVTLTGSFTNRLRVVRPTTTSGGDSHGIEVSGGSITKMEYVDSAGQNTSQCFKFNNGAQVQLMQYCRALGKLSPIGNNPVIFIDNTATSITMRDVTAVGQNTGGPAKGNSPLDITTGTVNIYDSIFTSVDHTVVTSGYINVAAGTVSIANSAIPEDGFVGESLVPGSPIQGTGAGAVAKSGNIVIAHPAFMQTLANYDWSEAAVSADGSNPNAGNQNVLRPGNSAAYTGMATSGNLVGGAGGITVPVTMSSFEVQ